MAKFVILHGLHRVKAVKQGDTIIPGVNFKRGDIIESNIDLEKRHPEKFRRVAETAKTTPREDRIPSDDDRIEENDQSLEQLAESDDNAATLSQMTVEQLRAAAVEEGIDVSKAKTKADLVKLLSMVRE